MKKNSFKLLVVLALSLFAMPIFASSINNLKATPDGRYLEFSWDPINQSDIDQETNYALQWSRYSGDVRIDKPVNATLSISQNAYRMLGDTVFEKDENYYIRVYGYYRDNRQTVLTNGSKILKFKWLSNGNIESSMINPSDPNIVTNNSSSSTTTESKTFSNLFASPYDTSVKLSWSNAEEYIDNYLLVISEKSDLSDPIGEFEIDSDTETEKALITELTPNKKYYVAGYFERDGRKFGKSKLVTFQTLDKFDAEKQRRFETYILSKRNYGQLFKSGQYKSTETSSSSSYNTNKTNTNVNVNSSSSEIKDRISELKALISKYKIELQTLEAKLPSSNNSNSKLSSFRSRLSNWRSYR